MSALPKIPAYDNETFHRDVCSALNQGQFDGACRPEYLHPERDIIAIEREDREPIAADQEAHLERMLSGTHAHDAMLSASGRQMIVTIKRPEHAPEDARGDRFLATLRGEHRSRFSVLSADEFVARPRPSWLVHGLIPAAEVGFLIAPWGVGKTFVALDLACAIQAKRSEWFGHRIKPGNVCIIAAEGASGVQLRYQAKMKAHGIAPNEMPSVIPAAPNLTSATDVHELITALHAHRRDEAAWQLIIVDTLAATTPGADELTGKDMGPLIANCKRIHAATGATVLLIGHTGKDESKGLRGWSGLEGAADFILEIVRDGEVRRLETRKMKDGRNDVSHAFRLKSIPLGVDEDGNEVSSCIVEPLETTTAKAGQRRRTRPKKGAPLLVLQMMESKFPNGAPTMGEVFEALEYKLQVSVKNPARIKEYFRDAVSTLADTEANQWLYRHGGERISLHPVIVADPSEFE